LYNALVEALSCTGTEIHSAMFKEAYDELMTVHPGKTKTKMLEEFEVTAYTCNI
jgi:hypothetical protein